MNITHTIAYLYENLPNGIFPESIMSGTIHPFGLTERGLAPDEITSL